MMKSAEFYARTAVAQAKAAVKFQNKYYICLALNTVYTAFIYGVISRDEWKAAADYIHIFGRQHQVDFLRRLQ